VANDVEEKGAFSCSDALLNKMDTISKWTIIDNLHGIPEDCPHREKCGWLGDAHAFCEYALYNYDMEVFYKKYMEDIRTQMRLVKGHNNPDRKYKVPTMIAPGKRTSTIAKLDWGIATIYLPWYNYKYYGDDTIVKEYYEDMKGLTNYYLSFKNEEGIIDNGMGDWCPPRWDRRGNPSAMECDPVTSANAYFYDILGIMEKFAKMNNDNSFAEKMNKEKAALYDAFNTTYLIDIPNTTHKWYGSQTATVMALEFEMVAKENLKAVVHGLAHDINEIKGGHHAVAYFYESLGGIKSTFQAPGYKEFTVNPQSPKQITQATVDIPTPYGKIHHNWEKKGANFSMNLKVPFNTKAKVILTKKEIESLLINGDKWEAFRKKHQTKLIDNSTIILGSGAYQMEYKCL